jgi:hypothetical protein
MNFSAVMEPLRAKHSILLAKSSVDGFELLASETKSDAKELESCKSDSKEHEQRFLEPLKMLKGIMFKRDQPYRTLLPLTGQLATSSSGVVNLVQSASSVASVAEWSSIDALFDEFFIHAYHIYFQPYNHIGAGIGTGTVASQPSLAVTNFAANSGLIMCNLYNGAAQYSTAAAMAANATHVMKFSGDSWKYSWRNSQRFDPRGDLVSTSNWQGWTLVSAPSNYAGQVQIRAANDTVLGGGASILALGTYRTLFDVSFRVRS